jgi:CBS domain-containing protein
MRDLLIRRMPVTDDAGIPIGVLSIDDVARVAYKAKFGSLDREFIRAMAVIGRPKAAAA